jgi:hypothetical protein
MIYNTINSDQLSETYKFDTEGSGSDGRTS